MAVATYSGSTIMGFLGPGDLYGETVKLYQQLFTGNFNPLCVASIPMSDLVDSAGQALVHLQSSFSGSNGISEPVAVFGSYRSEATTGGSVALIDATEATCLEPRQVNNCALDSNQRQGQALAGGASCVDSSGRKLLIVGAPGYSNNAGRIDVYAEGTHLGSAAPCGAPTNTPTVTPTVTPTAAPVLTTAPGFEGTRIPVNQRTSALPAPQVKIGTKNVSVTAPLLRSTSPLLRFTGWLFEISVGGKRASFSALKVEALRRASKKRQIFSKRNRISLRGLKSGIYTVSYRAVFRSKKKTQLLGKPSKAAIFTVR